MMMAAAKYLRLHNFMHPIVSLADALRATTKHKLLEIPKMYI